MEKPFATKKNEQEIAFSNGEIINLEIHSTDSCVISLNVAHRDDLILKLEEFRNKIKSKISCIDCLAEIDSIDIENFLE